MATVTKPIALDESFHTTETPSRNIADVLASLGDAISQGAQPVTKKLATNSFKTINGGLVDGLTVQFTPVQDLHGYSKPWAGGTGKNIAVPLSASTTVSSGVTVVNDGNNTVTVSGNYSGGAFDAVSVCSLSLDAGTYILNGQNNVDSANKKLTLQLYNADNSSQIANLEDGNDYTFSLAQTTNIQVNVGLRVGCNIPTPVTMNPMIRLASIADPTFEPYSNICPISGHTEAKAQINDTVYTTSLGGTEYGGEVEQVGGTGKQTFGVATLDGTETGWIYYPTSGGCFSLSPQTERFPNKKNNGTVYCDKLETVTNSTDFANNENVLYCASNINFKVGENIKTVSALTTWLASNNLQVVYELDTPTTLTLTGQNITAEVGTNNVSTPLTGQEIKPDSVIYKDMFTWEDVLKVI